MEELTWTLFDDRSTGGAAANDDHREGSRRSTKSRASSKRSKRSSQHRARKGLDRKHEAASRVIQRHWRRRRSHDDLYKGLPNKSYYIMHILPERSSSSTVMLRQQHERSLPSKPDTVTTRILLQRFEQYHHDWRQMQNNLTCCSRRDLLLLSHYHHDKPLPSAPSNSPASLLDMELRLLEVADTLSILHEGCEEECNGSNICSCHLVRRLDFGADQQKFIPATGKNHQPAAQTGVEHADDMILVLAHTDDCESSMGNSSMCHEKQNGGRLAMPFPKSNIAPSYTLLHHILLVLVALMIFAIAIGTVAGRKHYKSVRDQLFLSGGQHAHSQSTSQPVPDCGATALTGYRTDHLDLHSSALPDGDLNTVCFSRSLVCSVAGVSRPLFPPSQYLHQPLKAHHNVPVAPSEISTAVHSTPAHVVSIVPRRWKFLVPWGVPVYRRNTLTAIGHLDRHQQHK